MLAVEGGLQEAAEPIGRRELAFLDRQFVIQVGIALVQATGIAFGLEGMSGGQFVLDPGWSFRVMTIITLVGGTAFLMWLGEQVTERGIGNGISLIIFSGIVSGMPAGRELPADRWPTPQG